MKHYSQRDERWASEVIGFSKNQTIGDYGCLLCCVAMICIEFGHPVTPGALNELYRNVNGFDDANLIIRLVNSFYPDIYQAELIPCGKDIDAPLSTIDEYLVQGIPVIVQLDQSPQDGHQEHWVVIAAKTGSDYTILDPWDMESSGTSLVDDYGFNCKDPAKIITSVLILNRISVTQAQPITEDEYNAAVIASYGAALRKGPTVGEGTFLAFLPCGTRLSVTNEVKTVDGYPMREVRCYMAEADVDGTQILRVDE